MEGIEKWRKGVLERVSLQLGKNEIFAGRLDIKMTAHVRNAGLGDRVEGIPTRTDGYG